MDVPNSKGFRKDTKDKAWKRQGGRCAACGKTLASSNHKEGATGAWEAHHLKPRSYGGSDTLNNCALLCVNRPNCHLKVGHNGNYRNQVVLAIDDVPFFRWGETHVVAVLRNVRPMLDRIEPFL